MPIPQNREELTDQVESAFSKLMLEVDELTHDEADAICVEDWTVVQLLAIRAWWSEKVVEWVRAGRDGGSPDLPAPGYSWSETPRLNASIAASATGQDFADVRRRLEQAYDDVLALIADLDDRELLEPGVFNWAGKWPISRWLSINTARQYTTARAYIRRVKRRS